MPAPTSQDATAAEIDSIKKFNERLLDEAMGLRIAVQVMTHGPEYWAAQIEAGKGPEINEMLGIALHSLKFLATMTAIVRNAGDRLADALERDPAFSGE